MTSKEFCYWMRGYIESELTPTVDDRGRKHSAKRSYWGIDHLNKIKQMLRMVRLEEEITPPQAKESE